MKKCISILVLSTCLCAGIDLHAFFITPPGIAAAGPGLDSMEYFIDTDPGFGKGVPVLITHSSQINKSFNVDLTGVPVGFHILNVRVKQNTTGWSLTSSVPFYVVGSISPNIQQLEYFVDSDPGEGLGIQVGIAQSATVTQGFSINTAALPTGIHVLNVRTKDSNGSWSITKSATFYVISNNTSTITGAEYFFDADPGSGLATPLTVTSGASINENYALDITALTTGLHVFNIRTRDAAGQWSNTQSTPILIVANNQGNVAAVEYFIDSDPGNGNGTALTITPGMTIAEGYTIDISGLSTGLHFFNIRVKSISGEWSITQTVPFLNIGISQPDLTSAEYFFDTDPGIGSGTILTVSSGPDIAESYAIPTSGLATGLHVFNLRTRNSQGQWSITQSVTFVNVAASVGSISRLEYFIDTDPGEGSATPVSITPSPDVSTSFFIDASSLSPGIHVAGVRAQSIGGDWSIVTSNLFSVVKDKSNIIGIEYAVDNDPGIGQALYIAVTTPAISIAENFIIPLDTVLEGAHKIFFRTRNAEGNWSGTETLVMQVCNILPPVVAAENVTTNSFTLRWPKASSATQYHLDISRDGFNTFITGYNDKIITDTTETITGLFSDSTYQYRIRSEGYCLSDNFASALTTYQQTIPADSLALLDIYNTMNGANWIHYLNWLNGPVATWTGISVQNNRVAYIDLHGDTLTGSVPPSIISLDSLSYLNISGNNITDLPDLSSLTTIDSINVADNLLTFEDLELNTGLLHFIYAPQKIFGVPDTLTLFEGDQLNLSWAISGSHNLYQWQHDGVDEAGETNNALHRTAQLTDNGLWKLHVTNTLVVGLTIQTAETLVLVQQKGITADSLVLVSLYHSTNGNNWTNHTNWLAGNVSTWHGISTTGNNVTGIDLSNNNLTETPSDSLNRLNHLVSLNLSNNKINALPDLTVIPTLTSTNVSNNKLDFAALEKNIALVNFTYANQAALSLPDTIKVQVPASYDLGVNTGGTKNLYQWKFNGNILAGADSNVYQIADVNRATMGEYQCEVTNSLVTGLTLSTAPTTVFAVANISGKLYANATDAATKGKVTLFKIASTNGYDTIAIEPVNNNGMFQFADILLDDYQLLGFADTLTYPHVLPTYYKNTIYWEEADTIHVNGTLTGRDITSQLKPSSQPVGHGTIAGYVEEEFPGGRVLAPKRVSSAGVSVRRVERSGRGESETLTLVSYAFTDENGEFKFTNLDAKEYRINVQYPGYPMDTTSTLDVSVGTGLEAEKRVEAIVENGKIAVHLLVITGLYDPEGYPATVFPNPAHDQIVLHFANRSDERSVTINDVTGKPLLVAGADEQEVILNVRQFTEGIYFLKIHDQGRTVKVLRVLVQ
jgi:hypothetical protein